MYAVIATGGKQYKVTEGDLLKVEKLEGEVGGTLVFEKVLMLGHGAESEIGRPLLEGPKVEAEITDQGLGKKIIVFKFRPRQKYRRKQGHRQPYTELRITKIAK